MEQHKAHLANCGVTNLRDLGGYLTQSGKRIRYGQFYRSAALLPATQAHKNNLDALHLKTIVDFRSACEKINKMDYVSEFTDYCAHSGLRLLDNPDTSHYFDIHFLQESGRIEEMTYYMKDMYRQIALNNAAFKALFQYIKEGRTPLLFHCSSGKDRTGIGAALILLCLGVDKETVMADYLLSNQYRHDANERMIAHFDPAYRQKAIPLYYVQEDFLEAALDLIILAYGSLDAYYEKEHHLNKEDRQRLVDIYCE